MQHGDRPLIVQDTAAHPWAQRACELLGAVPARLSLTATSPPWDFVHGSSNVCRDRLAIELADRVDVAFVRPKGTIMRLLCERLQRDRSPTIQILLTDAENQAARKLIAHGAIGYWVAIDPHPSPPRVPPVASPPTASAATIHSLLHHPDRWLIHSTRARTGAWPGESAQQFNDWMLLSLPNHETPSPLETLVRMVRERRLVGSHRTTSTDRPVVCFSGLSIVDWLARRAFRPHLGRWDAEPYGIAIDREAARRLGIQPVIYGDQGELAGLEQAQRWRFQATGKTYDWTGEQEWRGRGLIDLTQFAPDEVVVFVQNAAERIAIVNCPWPVVHVAGQLRT